jgi:cytochrome c oxidase cbb3-type subunit 1
MEGLVKNYPYYQMRTVAGLVFTVGMLFFVYNVFMTMRRDTSPAAA